MTIPVTTKDEAVVEIEIEAILLAGQARESRFPDSSMLLTAYRSAQEGRLLFATTNRYHIPDPALTRPGRMDLHIEFRLSSRYQARELYKRFYVPNVLEDATEDGDDKDDEVAVDSGYVTPTQGVCDSPPSVPNGVGLEDPPPKYNGTAHSTRAPKLSRKKIEQLAEQFSSRIPERELSMARLQGYLMSYKSWPFGAVERR